MPHVEWTDREGALSTFNVDKPILVTGDGTVAIRDGGLTHTRSIKVTATNTEQDTEEKLNPSFHLQTIIPDAFEGEIGIGLSKEFWEGVEWEWVQAGLTIAILVVGIMGMPCCFLFTRGKWIEIKKRREERGEERRMEAEVRAIKSKYRKNKNKRSRTKSKSPHEAVVGFLEEFTPRNQPPPSRFQPRFTEIECL